MNENYWRVDTGLLTCVSVDKNNLYDDTPIEAWLPALFGDGYYRYYVNEQDAKSSLVEIIDSRIEELENLKRSFQI